MPARRVVVKAEPVSTPHVCESKLVLNNSPSIVKKSVGMSGIQELEEDLLKGAGDEIFSVCDGSQDNDDSPVSEIGEYELNYLHNLYQQTDILSTNCNNGFTILPDAVAPPSLSLNVSGTEGAHLSLLSQSNAEHPASEQSTLGGNGNDGATVKNGSQPDTPPRQGLNTHWVSEGSSRGASPFNSAQTAKAAKAGGRKRKAAEPGAAMSGLRNQRVVAYENSKAADGDPCEKESNESSSDRGQSPCPSLSHLTEIFEIRPEDDPHGLFSKDPATLTLEEQRLVKKQRRLLKNRESAQLSRHRKKMHLNALERQVPSLIDSLEIMSADFDSHLFLQVEVLKKERAALSTRVQELFEENERLRKQVLASI